MPKDKSLRRDRIARLEEITSLRYDEARKAKQFAKADHLSRRLISLDHAAFVESRKSRVYFVS